MKIYKEMTEEEQDTCRERVQRTKEKVIELLKEECISFSEDYYSTKEREGEKNGKGADNNKASFRAQGRAAEGSGLERNQL